MLVAQWSKGKYAAAQKQKSATAVHLPFDELEPVHLAFNLPIAPGLFYRRKHCFMVPLDSGDEALHLGDLRLHASYQPGFERVGIPVLECLAELLSQLFSCGNQMSNVSSTGIEWYPQNRCRFPNETSMRP